MVLDYYASSPVLLSHSTSAFHTTSQSTKRHIPKYPQPPSINYLARVSNGVAGRKRSRDGEDDHAGELEATSKPIAMPPKPEPVLGPGMTLVYPAEPQLNISAESQSGTWMEEYNTDSPTARPRLVARKSRCMAEDLPAVQSIESPAGIDPILRELGIGWRQLTDTQQSAIAGSETYIRNQYDLNSPKIVLQHEGLGIYVVKSEPLSAQGYWSQWWLFQENLKSCRFLCNDDSQLFARLSNKRLDERGHWVPDIKYEGPEVYAKDMHPKPQGGILSTSFNSVPRNIYAGGQVMQINSTWQHVQPESSIEDVEMQGVA